MKVVFRVDASIKIGTGHVMRCLTLADALKQQGAEIQFICRVQSGHLIRFIESRGYNVFSLQNTWIETDSAPCLDHADWLGCTQTQDANDCKAVLQHNSIDWLIVDHYALDINWEASLKPFYKKLMVIDDLADRQHDCAVLLDQTYDRISEDYLPWVNENCQLLLGSGYALLRAEFAKWREYSLSRRARFQFNHLLISMGGVDKDNITGQVLEVLKSCVLPQNLNITILMGTTAPHLERVKKMAQAMPFKTDVISGINNVAEVMANTDLAIGAAGATTWERCCLGVPSILIPIAKNQQGILQNLTNGGICESLAIFDLHESKSVLNHKIELILSMMDKYIKKASEITEGTGVNKVMETLYV